jgi:hypothetical protein
MAIDLFLIYLISLIFLTGALAFSNSLRWKHERIDSESGLIGIPLYLWFSSLLGALLTVGFKSSITLISIPLIGFLIWNSSLNLKFRLIFSSSNWLIMCLFHLFWLLQDFALADFQEGDFRLTHHDDYSYINLVNLIQFTGKESLFTELNRVVHGLDGEFKFYHYFEFYLIAIIQKIGGRANYLNYHFFLVPILQTLAFAQFHQFVRLKTGISSWVLFSFSLLLFSSMRYFCVDEWLNAFLGWKYFKGVFFQNYSYPHPLSFFFGYKLCLAFIFVLPFLYFQDLGKKTQAAFFIGLSSMVSIALLPLVFGSFILSQLSRFIPPKSAFYLASGLLLVSLSLLWSADFSVTVDLSAVPGRIQKLVNLLFENYFLVIALTALVVIIKSKLSNRIFLAGLPLFPLVYLAHGILFKLYLLYLVALAIYFLAKSQKSTGWEFIFKPQYTAMIGLFVIVPIFNSVADFGQIFFNLVFLMLLVFILDFLSSAKVGFSSSAGGLFFGLFLVFNLPAIRFDRSMPVKDERIPNLEVFDPEKQKGPVRVLSIARYRHLPYLYHDILGNAILNHYNHVFISPGGLEFIDSTGIQNLKNSGHWTYVNRIPYFEYMQSHPEPGPLALLHYVEKYSINALCVENDSVFKEYISLIQPLVTNRIQVKDGNYEILLLKSNREKLK